MDLSRLGVVNLWDYNVLILPEGVGRHDAAPARRRGPAQALGPGRRQHHRVRRRDFAAHQASESALSTVGVVGADTTRTAESARHDSPPDTTLSVTARPGPPLVSADRARDRSGPRACRASSRARRSTAPTGSPTDTSGDQLAVQVSNDFLTPSTKGDNPVSFVGKDLVLAGFAWPNNTERLLTGTAWAVVENVGQGKVILFADNPLFRAFWRGTAGLFLNALLFGPGR